MTARQYLQLVDPKSSPVLCAVYDVRPAQRPRTPATQLSAMLSIKQEGFFLHIVFSASKASSRTWLPVLCHWSHLGKATKQAQVQQSSRLKGATLTWVLRVFYKRVDNRIEKKIGTI